MTPTRVQERRPPGRSTPQRLPGRVLAHGLSVALLSFAALLSAGCVSDSQFEMPAAIQSAAEQFALSGLPDGRGSRYATAAPLDADLRLRACASPLQAFSVTSAAAPIWTTVGVRCTTNARWTLYVPVTIELEAPVLVLRRALARRARIETTDVELQTRRLPGMLTSFINDAMLLQGHRLKRALAAGTPLTADVLAPDVLMHRGQKVMLMAANGPIEIRAEALTLTREAPIEFGFRTPAR